MSGGGRIVSQESLDRLGKQVDTHSGQLAGERAGGVRGAYGSLSLRQDRARVDLWHGSVERDTGARCTIGDRPVDRLRTAVLGDEAGMDVHPAVRGDVEGARSNDLVETGHNDGFWFQAAHHHLGVLVVDAPGTYEGNVEVLREAAQRVVTEDCEVCAGRGDQAAELHLELQQREQERQAEVGGESGEGDSWPAAR